ncbi:PepSY domain-containing protein, partial [Streptomyces sp. MCAF7]
MPDRTTAVTTDDGSPTTAAGAAGPPLVADARPPGWSGRKWWTSLRPLVLRLHFYAGVVVAPFLLVAAVTGLLYAASFEAEKIVYDHELRVPVGERELPVSQQVDAARAAHPE